MVAYDGEAEGKCIFCGAQIARTPETTWNHSSHASTREYLLKLELGPQTFLMERDRMAARSRGRRFTQEKATGGYFQALSLHEKVKECWV